MPSFKDIYDEFIRELASKQFKPLKPEKSKHKSVRNVEVKVIENPNIGGLAILLVYAGRTIFIPPIVSEDTTIYLPKKYKKLLNPEIFPEIKFVEYGRA